MNRFVFILSLAAIAVSATSQTAPKIPANGSATPKNPAASTTSTAKSSATSSAPASAAPAPWIKLPPGVPRVAHGLVKIPIALRYEDITVGTGAPGESGKVWHLKYTGYRAADGVKFDSWDAHGQPVVGKDGKLELGPDGKPKMGDPPPIAFPQGTGRVIPGFDYGLDGMKIGGKRRIFIPWQLAYGTRAMPDRPDHPGIPAKSDLIFDVELVDVTEMPAPNPAAMPGMRPGVPPHPSVPPQPAAPTAAPAPATAPATPPTTPPTQPSTPPQPQ